MIFIWLKGEFRSYKILARDGTLQAEDFFKEMFIFLVRYDPKKKKNLNFQKCSKYMSVLLKKKLIVG